ASPVAESRSRPARRSRCGDGSREPRLDVKVDPVDTARARLPGPGPVAIVDIGSNSVRLVVYERLSRSATPLFNEKELCGLDRGMATRGRLHPRAQDHALHDSA